MKISRLYLFLCVLGFIIPYSQFIHFLMEQGPDFPLFFEQLFASRVSAFFGLDVVISTVILIAFILKEGTSLKMRYLWLPLAGTLCVGVSFGLPLFLFMRERKIEGR